MIEIRKATKEDLQDINSVYVEAAVDEMMLQYPLRSRKEMTKDIVQGKNSRIKNWKKEMSSKEYLWLVAEKDKKIIGFSVAEIRNKKNGWLALNYILREFRGKGLGKKLTRMRIKWLKRQKIREVFAHTFVNNAASRKNLSNFGFKPSGLTLARKL